MWLVALVVLLMIVVAMGVSSGLRQPRTPTLHPVNERLGIRDPRPQPWVPSRGL